MILAPVVASRVKMIQLCRAESVVPAHAKHVGELPQVVVVDVKAGQPGGAVGARLEVLAVITVVAGNPVSGTKVVVSLDTDLGDRRNLGAIGDAEIVVHVTHCARRSARVGRQGTAGLIHADRFDGEWIEQALGNQVVGELLSRDAATGV